MQNGDTVEAQQGGTLRFSWNSDAKSLAPHQFTASIERCIGGHLFETLVAYDESAGEFVPGLATTWEAMPDGKKWTFRLRDGVKFHDGTAFDANAIKFTFDWIAAPDSKASPFTTGFLAGYAGTEVVSPTEAEVTFDEPNGRFFDGVAGYYLSILSPTAVEQLGEDFSSKPVGTGPFKLQEWVPNDHITLVRNADHTWGFPGYSHEGTSYLDEVVVRIIGEDATRSAALERQEVDMINLSFSDTPRFATNQDLQTVVNLRPGTVRAVHFNAMSGPLSNVEIRQAVAHAVNAEAIVKAPFFGGAAAVARTPLSPTMVGYDERLADLAAPYEPDTARQLLEQAGWLVGDNGIRHKDGRALKFTIGAASSTFLGQVAQLVQAQLAEVGIDSELTITDWTSLFGVISNGDYDLLVGGAFQSDLGVLDVVYAPETMGKNGLLFTRYPNDELTNLRHNAAATVTPEERLKAYYTVQEYAMKNVLVVPVYIEPYVFVATRKLTGVRSNVDGEPRFHDAHFS